MGLHFYDVWEKVILEKSGSEANHYSLWGKVSCKTSPDFRRSHNDVCCPRRFTQEHGPSFNLRKNVDLTQHLSLGQVAFFVISQVAYLVYTCNKKYVNIEFSPQINYLGFLNLGELTY